MTSSGDLFKITRRMEEKTLPPAPASSPHPTPPDYQSTLYRGRATPNDNPRWNRTGKKGKMGKGGNDILALL